MKSKDILANFGRTCKRFRCLSLDSEVIKYLDLININDKVKYDGAIKVIKRSKNLKRISIGLSLPYWKHLMNHALKKSSFRSLELTDQVLPNSTRGGIDRDNKTPRFTTKDLEKMVDLGKKLETLKIRNIKIEPKDFKLVANIKSLKSLHFFDKYDKLQGIEALVTDENVYTPENIVDLAKNCKYLETINFIFDSSKVNISHHYANSLKRAMDDFFSERRSTLKSLDFEGISSTRNFLQNISLCENLEELTLKNCTLSLESGIKSISCLKGLKKLVVINNAFGHCVNHMDYSNLKYLVVMDTFLGIENFERLSKKQFPQLERAYITIPGYSEQATKDFLTNCPMIKSAHLPAKTKWNKDFNLDPQSAVSMINLMDMAIKKNIYLEFGSDIIMNLEFALLQNGITESQSAILDQYHAMKTNFDQWCKNNSWWIDALSQSKDSKIRWWK